MVSHTLFPHSPNLNLLPRLLILLLLGSGTLFIPSSVIADPATSPISQLFRKAPEFLPVEQAFPVDATITSADTIGVYFEITPEHYLYRHGFAFIANGKPLEPASWPQGKEHQDEYFGRVEIYRGNIAFQLPAPATQDGTLELLVRYQGCADAGLCYPPAEARFQLTVPRQPSDPAKTPGSAATADATLPSRSPSSPPEIQGLLWFLLAGLALTFTPCVLPMLPILSSVILGPGGQITTRRATTLTLTYVGSMAMTFALAGVLVGYFGARLNLQAHLQNPWIIGAFAALFVALALSMFDLYEIRVPQRLTQLTGAAGEPGSLTGAAMMGAVSSLVVSPCVTAPLAGALLYIAATGDALYGGLALLSLGLGMGIPLIIAGVSGGRFLPRSGAWMTGVKRLFGVLMIGVAIWMLERFMAGPVTLGLWAGLALLCAAGAQVFATESVGRLRVTATGVAMASFLLAGIWMAGALSGGQDIWRPLENLTNKPQDPGRMSDFHSKFIQVDNLQELQQALQGARAAARPAFVDVYADWCISCRIMEQRVLGSARVQALLQEVTLIRADVTANTGESAAIMEYFGIFGPPAWIFLNGAGEEIPELRVVGEIHEDEFFSLLNEHKSRL